MNVYDAIMSAADHIEGHPKEFYFMSYSCPTAPGCGSHGCALGWISTFLGLGRQSFIRSAMLLTNERFTTADDTFYARMDQLNNGRNWRDNYLKCARALRLYAAKYHAPAKRTDAELVCDLMQKVMKEHIPEDA